MSSIDAIDAIGCLLFAVDDKPFEIGVGDVNEMM
jgi:hypothetical protein